MAMQQQNRTTQWIWDHGSQNLSFRITRATDVNVDDNDNDNDNNNNEKIDNDTDDKHQHHDNINNMYYCRHTHHSNRCHGSHNSYCWNNRQCNLRDECYEVYEYILVLFDKQSTRS